MDKNLSKPCPSKECPQEESIVFINHDPKRDRFFLSCFCGVRSPLADTAEEAQRLWNESFVRVEPIFFCSKCGASRPLTAEEAQAKMTQGNCGNCDYMWSVIAPTERPPHEKV